MDQSETVRFLVRLKPDVRRWVEEQAAKDLSPMNSVINRTLRNAMEAEQRAAG